MIWLRVFVKALEVKSVFFIIDLGGRFAAAAHHAGICAGVRNAVIHDLAFNFDEEDLLLLQADGGFADFGEERAETAVEPACKLREIVLVKYVQLLAGFGQVLEELVVFVFGFLANAAGVQGNERHGRKGFFLPGPAFGWRAPVHSHNLQGAGKIPSARLRRQWVRR